MIQNHKADTLFFTEKRRYPLRPIFISKNELNDSLNISVEPGTIIDIQTQQEYSVLQKRAFFNLKRGQSLLIVADVDFKKQIDSGDFNTFEPDEESGENKPKPTATYKVYVKRYEINGFNIVVDDGSETINNSFLLCIYPDIETDSETDSETDEFFADPLNEFFPEDFMTRYHQLYVFAELLNTEGIIFSKEGEEGFLPEITKDEEGNEEQFARLNYFF
jgi:hypothetical protein